MRGNKGEWSELYVLAVLLSQGKIDAADSHLNRIEDVYFPVFKVFRDEQAGQKKLVYEIKDKPLSVVNIYVNGEYVGCVERDSVQDLAELIYTGIITGQNRSFEIEAGTKLMSQLECGVLKAPSSEKSDISLLMHDIHTGYNQICGFSIKSELGSSPTLMNASKATNFIFEIEGIDDATMESVNLIDTKNKIIDRMEILKRKSWKFVGLANETFAGNLMMIDSMMDDILGYIIRYAYFSGENSLLTLTRWIEEDNPLQIKRRGYYEYKIKKFLCAVALGMTPAKEWDGRDEANGGYIVVTERGEVLAFHLYNRNYFEDFLLEYTKLERASTSRHEFASVYKENGKYYIKLNLQIRFN